MKKLLFLLALVCSVSVMQADEPQKNGGEPQKFSPEKFQAELERFMTQEAGLTADESAKFFPLYREMLSGNR